MSNNKHNQVKLRSLIQNISCRRNYFKKQLIKVRNQIDNISSHFLYNSESFEKFTKEEKEKLEEIVKILDKLISNIKENNAIA